MTDTSDDTSLAAIVFIILGALIALPVLLMGLGMLGAGHTTGGLGPSGMMDGAAAGWMLLVWAIVQFLFLAAVVGGLYLVYRAIAGGDDGTDPALAALRQAYARGEVSDEEYETRRERLERDG